MAQEISWMSLGPILWCIWGLPSSAGGSFGIVGVGCWVGCVLIIIILCAFYVPTPPIISVLVVTISTHNPPFKQRLAVVGAGAGW